MLFDITPLALEEHECQLSSHMVTHPPNDKGQCVLASVNSLQRILRCLGAAVLLQWNELPSDIQRALFEGATAMNDPDRQFRLKQLVARFLHIHKDDA
jgi:hypothetical protein